MLEITIKAVQTAEATIQQIGILQKKPKEINFIKTEKKNQPVGEDVEIFVPGKSTVSTLSFVGE